MLSFELGVLVLAIVPSPRTWVDGELLTADAMNTDVRDAVKFLMNPPTCSVALGSNVDWVVNSWFDVPWDQVVANNDGMFDAANNTRITVNTDGMYLIVFDVSWTKGGSDGATMIAAVWVNGSNVGRISIDEPTVSYPSGLSLTRAFQLSAGDYLQFRVYQSGGTGPASLSGSGSEQSRAFVRWVGAT